VGDGERGGGAAGGWLQPHTRECVPAVSHFEVSNGGVEGAERLLYSCGAVVRCRAALCTTSVLCCAVLWNALLCCPCVMS
jgi:hypothetical protein